MTTNSSPILAVGKQPNLNEVAPACVEVQRLSTESERIAQKRQTDRQTWEPPIRRESSKQPTDAGQQGLYWLIWAVVLAGLALGIFGS